MFDNRKTILITGVAGFIGSNFVKYFLDTYEYNIVGLDALTYAGNIGNMESFLRNERFKFIKGDICNNDLLEFLFKEYCIKGVIHFAAESHVDNSIKDPSVFIKTNINGTFNLLDVSYKNWMAGPFVFKIGFEDCKFHHISTDEVYGTLELDSDNLFTEASPYAPNSPYSASKAASDMLARSYFKTYGLNTLITNCSNNYGPFQNDEKLIPTIIKNALLKKAIPIYGDGKNVRDWLYVLDHCKAIDLVYHSGRVGDVYNIGGQNEYTNLQIANIICDILDKRFPISNFSYKDLITFVDDRVGHDRRYAINASKLKNQLGWRIEYNFENGIINTIEWYLEKYKAFLV